jgi:oligogalacturonide transport system permease protein
MKKHYNTIIAYLLLSLLGIFMIYPLLWLVGSSFKTNQEIFSSVGLIPKKFILDSYAKGWKGSGQYTYTTFFLNTFKFVIPSVVYTVVSSVLVSYGFARFKFPFKKQLFALVIATLMLPNAIVIIPKYIMFKNFGWLNTYLPFTIPALAATHSFFIFMLVQFFRGIPKDLDESAKIDGCNSFTILMRILLPVAKPAIFSVAIFEFIWKWNDFFNVLIYINSVKKFPLALALRMSIDLTDAINWNQLMAMSVLSMLPPILIFFFAQRYFVEGIATTGLKG